MRRWSTGGIVLAVFAGLVAGGILGRSSSARANGVPGVFPGGVGVNPGASCYATTTAEGAVLYIWNFEDPASPKVRVYQAGTIAAESKAAWRELKIAAVATDAK